MARVLVVDDEQNIRMAFSELLRRDGHEVYDAGDVKGAFALLNQYKFDVALLDIHIDERQSGLDLLAAIKDNHSDVEVIMVTGKPMASNVYQALCEGIFVFLVKPVMANELREVVRSAANPKAIKTSEKTPSEI
ncbi:MAG: response regulator [Candidatus Alcyoniella australis]|nr:response regulator [Candidatus Alcyoniella australis]